MTESKDHTPAGQAGEQLPSDPKMRANRGRSIVRRKIGEAVVLTLNEVSIEINVVAKSGRSIELDISGPKNLAVQRPETGDKTPHSQNNVMPLNDEMKISA